MFKKKKVAAGGFRKRAQVEDEADEAHVAPYKKPKRETRALQFSTKGDDDEGASSDEEEGVVAVWASSRSVAPKDRARGGAFAEVEIDARTDTDARALLEKKLKLQKEGLTNDDTKIYKGQVGYKSYANIQESQVGANKYTGTRGPIRAPQFVRNTCRFDYQPDVCKDYKDTGFCGYGDSCKFMHDRGEFKTGWQLEAEFQRQKAKNKEKEMLGKLGDDDSDDDERFQIQQGAANDLPFACHLCRGPFRAPVETFCKHYFCMNCIQGRFTADSNTRCPICQKQTSGVLNKPTKLLAKAKQLEGGFQELFEKSCTPDEEE